MEKSMLLMLLVFSVLNILPSSLSVHYKYVNVEKTWHDAQMYCREKYTDLATIYDMSSDPFKGFPSSSAWIGLSPGSWTWSLDDEMLNYTYTTFDQGNNSTVSLDENAICEKMMNHLWNNISCSHKLSFVCYDKNDEAKYVCISHKKTWEEAQRYCRANHTDLTSVKNKDEHKQIFAVIDKKKYEDCYTGFWIGLSRVKWQWSDQSVFQFQNWQKRNHGENKNPEQCVEMSVKSGEWKTKPCDKMNPFICYDDDLVLVKENKTWVEALDHCRDLGLDLVSVHSAKIQHLVQSLARKATTPYVWLGLRYNCTLQVWFWVSEHGLCHQNWAQGHGRRWAECKTSGAMPSQGPGQWEGRNQEETFNFICTRSPDDY